MQSKAVKKKTNSEKLPKSGRVDKRKESKSKQKEDSPNRVEHARRSNTHAKQSSEEENTKGRKAN